MEWYSECMFKEEYKQEEGLEETSVLNIVMTRDGIDIGGESLTETGHLKQDLICHSDERNHECHVNEYPSIPTIKEEGKDEDCYEEPKIVDTVERKDDTCTCGESLTQNGHSIDRNYQCHVHGYFFLLSWRV